MRIISGKYRGRRIAPPRNLPVRPTTDFAKEALFNILENHFDIEKLRVLDLFCGTGGISFEFASRGAQALSAVDRHPRCCRFVQQTMAELGVTHCRVHRSEVGAFVKRCRQSFNIIFADPPYDLPQLPELPDAILEAGILEREGWLILEHPVRHSFIEHPRFRERRTYGSVNFSIFS